MSKQEQAIAAYLAGDLDGVRAVYAQYAAFLGIEDTIPASMAHDDTCYAGEATISDITIMREDTLVERTLVCAA